MKKYFYTTARCALLSIGLICLFSNCIALRNDIETFDATFVGNYEFTAKAGGELKEGKPTLYTVENKTIAANFDAFIAKTGYDRDKIVTVELVKATITIPGDPISNLKFGDVDEATFEMKGLSKQVDLKKLQSATNLPVTAVEIDALLFRYNNTKSGNDPQILGKTFDMMPYLQKRVTEFNDLKPAGYTVNKSPENTKIFDVRRFFLMADELEYKASLTINRANTPRTNLNFEYSFKLTIKS
jgi:hypothetical protein